MLENEYVREPGYATRYRDARFASGSGPRTHRRELAVITALLRAIPESGGAWLDVPSGAGRASDALPQPVVQVDRDRAMLGACAGRVGRLQVCASALRLPFADASFAGVLCLRLLQHLDDAARPKVIGELARVTARYVLLSYFEAHSIQHWRRRLRRALGKRRSGRGAVAWPALRHELAAAGLRVLARRPLARFVSEQTLVLAVRQP